ncbi:hypothetical protein [Anaerosacchariphilus polymeriproducens]|uniref:hypothetical protein n=1 Tax=Anaerosacchariphilus polymeriproducens TaxID=1812858 RepID=UPI0011C034E3|nr:hypothetical protein [Anaerosacchariphilus polymeriproducens]
MFTCDISEQIGNYISITCFDNMYKLDKELQNISGLAAGAKIADICDSCGVSLKTMDFDGYDRQLILNGTFPEGCTYRQALSFVCQAIGKFARFDQNGQLEIIWYDNTAFVDNNIQLDGGKFDANEPYYLTGDNEDGGDFSFLETDSCDAGSFEATKAHYLYQLSSLTCAINDVYISGIKVSYDESAYLCGTADYALAIEDNPYTAGFEEETAIYLYTRMAGMSFQPLSVSCLSNPLIEEGDAVFVIDRKGNIHKTFATNVNFTIRQNTQITCDAETPQANSSEFGSNTQTIIQTRNIVKKEMTSYDVAVQCFNDLISHSFGLYKTEEVQTDGSVIYYMHNKPTLAESMTVWKQTADAFAVSTDGGQTWNAGFDAQGNAILNVLSAIGINAEWIKVLTEFNVNDNFIVNSSGQMSCKGAVIDNTNFNVTASGDTTVKSMTIVNDGYIKQVVGEQSSSSIKFISGSLIGDIGSTLGFTIGRVDEGAYIFFRTSGGVISEPEMPRKRMKIFADRLDISGIDQSPVIYFDGYRFSDPSSTTDTWGTIPRIGKNDGVMEVGKYIDFHNSDGSTSDYDARLNCVGNTLVLTGGLSVSGTKNRIVQTEHYGIRALSAYETATPYFGDIGSGKTDENGECRIDIEPIFLETIEKDYKVFIQPCGIGSLYAEKHEGFFIVKGAVNLEFDFEIKGYQKGYKDTRLTEYIEEE